MRFLGFGPLIKLGEMRGSAEPLDREEARLPLPRVERLGRGAEGPNPASPSTKTVHGAGRAGCPVKGFKQEKDLKANRPQVEPPQNLPKRTADPSPRSRASGTRNVSPGRQTHRCRRRGCGNFSVGRLPVLGLWTEKLRFQPEKPKITVANKTFPQH